MTTAVRHEGPFQPPPAAYTVTAQLAGFETAMVMVRASDGGVDSSFTIRLRLSCFEPDLVVIPDLQTLVPAADVVAVVRLDSVGRGYQARLGDEWCGPITKFRATIVEPVKDRRSQQSPFIRFDLPGQALRPNPGDTYIAILQWHPRSRAYRVMSGGYFMPVRAGQAHWPDGNKKPLAEVLSVLRSANAN